MFIWVPQIKLALQADTECTHELLSTAKRYARDHAGNIPCVVYQDQLTTGRAPRIFMSDVDAA